jgi:hypothetical protein
MGRFSTNDRGCAGINRHVVGDERALQERSSESILTPSLATGAARSQLKRKQGHRWAGLLSFENVQSETPTSSSEGEGNTTGHVRSRAPSRLCVV